MYTRARQPYKRKTASKGGALIFGLGLGSLMATIAIVIGITVPNISSRLENIPYYARTYYRKLLPHPEYLPTPAPTVSAAITSGPNNDGSVELDLPGIANESSPGEVIPAVVQIDSDSASSPEVIVNIGAAENLLMPEPSSDVVLQPIGHQVQLAGMNHQWQTWNNCGPATITTQMSYFGHLDTQAEAAQFLKPNTDDKNVSPHELAAYARTAGMGAIVRQGGTIEQIKLLLNNNFPVLAETWLLHDGDGLGHYRLLNGYDDATGQFNTSDSLNGPDFKVSYEQLDADWRVFNRLYVVIFPPLEAEIVSNIVGEDLNDPVMYDRLIAMAQAEIAANPGDVIAHFNHGEALTRQGRYQEAVAAFDQARTIGLHWRRLWYQFTPFEAYYAVGRHQDVLDLAKATIRGTGGLEEAYYYQGLSLHATGQPRATASFEAALAHNPNFAPAKEALRVLTASQ
jgi:tetratricopeptide (TPR) repeat protein